jgi:hypothetical protein
MGLAEELIQSLEDLLCVALNAGDLLREKPPVDGPMPPHAYLL